jgi:hypothetical protein
MINKDLIEANLNIMTSTPDIIDETFTGNNESVFLLEVIHKNLIIY